MDTQGLQMTPNTVQAFVGEGTFNFGTDDGAGEFTLQVIIGDDGILVLAGSKGQAQLAITDNGVSGHWAWSSKLLEATGILERVEDEITLNLTTERADGGVGGFTLTAKLPKRNDGV